MKIAIDLTSLSFNASGIERYARSIAKNIMLSDRENSYHVLFSNEVPPDFVFLSEDDNVEVTLLSSGDSKWDRFALMQFKLPAALRQIQPDITLFCAFAPPVLFFGDSIVTVHDLGVFDLPEMWNWYSALYGRITLSRAMKRAKYVVVDSEFTKQRVDHYFPARSNDVRVAYLAVDENLRESRANVEHEERIRRKYSLPSRFILCLSTLEPRKNLPLLINAYCNLQLEAPNDHHLVLAGRRGWKVDDLLHDVPNEIRDKITITGFIDEEDLPALYRLASVFCFPSVYEGFGIPPLEALSCDCPTLLSNIPVFKEVYGNAVEYFTNNNLGSLKETLGRIVESGSSVDSQTRLECVSRYEWGSSAATYIDLIKELKTARFVDTNFKDSAC